MAFDLSTAQPAQSGGFDLSTAKSAAPEIQEATQEPRVIGRAGRAQRIRQDQPEPIETPEQPEVFKQGLTGRAGRAQKLRIGRRDTQELTNRFEAGEITSADLTPEQVDAVRLERIKRIPEISDTGFSALTQNEGFLGALSDFASSAAALTAFDPDEFGAILQQADKNIGIVTTPEGERLAVHNITGDAVSLNKLGPSLIDALQIGGAVSALTPSGAAKTILGRGAAAAVTQAVIEAGQVAAGGELNPEDIAIAGVAGPVLEKGFQAAKSSIVGLRNRLGIQKPAQQVAQQPAQQVAQQPAQEARATPLSLEPIEEVAPRKFNPLFGQESKNTTLIREAIESGKGDAVTAGYMLEGSRKVVADPAARELMKQGKATNTFDPGKVALFGGSSNNDRVAFGKMLDIVEKGRTNAKFAAENRPGKIVGDSFMKRYRHVQKVNRDAGVQVGKAAKALKGSDVDLSQSKAGFIDSLDDSGVSIGKGNKLNFEGSTFEGDPGTTKLISDLWKRMLNIETSRDGLHIHRAKKFIDNKVDVGKRSASPITADAERIALNMRANINNALRESSENYKVANDTFSETIGPLKEFQKLSGKNFDPESPNANEFVGKISRGILSNIRSREKIIDTLHDLERVGAKHGGKFNDDVTTQIMFVEELEKTFGAFAPTSLAGETAKAGAQAIRGDRLGAAISAGGSVISKARRINEDQAIKALRDFTNKRVR